MSRQMLIDAAHPEETRVVTLNNNRLEEFDLESASKKQLKGNIYLAKVTRVEPSLQAAFVDYGGNRHGFLPFSEIHPDYYRIPIADREALLAEEAALRREAEDEDDEAEETGKRGRGRRRGGRNRRAKSNSGAKTTRKVRGKSDEDGEAGAEQSAEADAEVDAEVDSDAAEEAAVEAASDDETPVEETSEALDATADSIDEDTAEDSAEPTEIEAADGGSEEASEEDPEGSAEAAAEDQADDGPRANGEDHEAGAEGLEAAEAEADAESGAEAEADAEDGDEDEEEPAAEAKVDTVGGDEAEEDANRRARLMRRYKIQEVIKRRQVLLVQVTKEERGNKGAALTTYLSLAGRYCVLMPNTNKGGGISRKISNATDRRRLKKIVSELEIPEGVAVIVRTAGSERTKPEIKRDYEYLLRLWNEIRENTMESMAPSLIHEEANLMTRAIRDLYTREMDDVLVAGEDGYKSAKAFMKSLMPSHARKVKLYKDPAVPLFQKFKVENQLDAMHSSTVQLRSGGYIVINPTEALVAIDVNSGRATKERHIEETALRTNLEAAEEVARQLRLRDLAGLIVIDFIDMEESRHNRAVERKLKDAMRNDRARIQLGRISPFGLLELSRQRLRPSLQESSTVLCPQCAGSGRLRSVDSTALHVLRMLEEEGVRKPGGRVRLAVPTDVALYILNQNRERLVEIEQRYEFKVEIERNDELIPPNYELRHSADRGAGDEADEGEAQARESGRERGRGRGDRDRDRSERDRGEHDDDGRKRGRRRRRGKGREEGRDEEAESEAPSEAETATEEAAEGADDQQAASGPEDGDDEGRKSRRRRGKRGGRRRSRRRKDEDAVAAQDGEPRDGDAGPDDGAEQTDGEGAVAETEVAEASEDDVSEAPADTAEATATDGDTVEADAEEEKRPRRRSRRKSASGETKRPARRRKAPAKADTKTGDEADSAEAIEAPADEDQPSPSPPPWNRRSRHRSRNPVRRPARRSPSRSPWRRPSRRTTTSPSAAAGGTG